VQTCRGGLSELRRQQLTWVPRRRYDAACPESSNTTTSRDASPPTRRPLRFSLVHTNNLPPLPADIRSRKQHGLAGRPVHASSLRRRGSDARGAARAAAGHPRALPQVCPPASRPGKPLPRRCGPDGAARTVQPRMLTASSPPHGFAQ
jgi:hypothetical protein